MNIYVIHPFRGKGAPGERESNRTRIAEVCLSIAALGHTPISPVHCFSWLNDHDPDSRVSGMDFALRLLECCHEAWVYGAWRSSAGCKREIMVAATAGLKVKVYDPADGSLKSGDDYITLGDLK